MTTLAQILDEMANKIRDVVRQVEGIDVQVEPRMILNPTVPSVDVYPYLAGSSLDIDTAAFGELTAGELITVRARVSTADTEAGQDLLLAMMDDEDDLSLVNALADDPTLNGLGRIDVRDRSGYALFPAPQGDGAYLGFTLTTVVLKARS